MHKKTIRPIRIEGNIAYVPLTKGYEAIVDLGDLHLVSGENWCAHQCNGNFYAYRKIPNGKWRQQTVIMHRVIFGGSPPTVDHIDMNGLNNRRNNLRAATKSQNAQNAKISVANKSGFKGVSWNSQTCKWRARIGHRGKSVHLGRFSTPELAYSAYCEANARLHGEFGRVA